MSGDPPSDGRQVFQRAPAEAEVQGGTERTRALKAWWATRPPALVPLVIGFVLLLGLVLALGLSSARQLDNVSDEVLDLQQRRSTQLRLLLNLRLALTELNNEARTRAEAAARDDFLPPFAVRLRNARTRTADIIPRFRDLPLIAPADKERFTNELNEFLAVTESTGQYNLEGFNRYRSLDEQLDRFRDQADAAQEDVERRTNELQQRARSRIRFTMLLALLAGLAVAAGTIWEAQRRFRQVGESLAAAKREREFSTQALEGMPSAVATFDARRRLRSANKAFFDLFPRASIGATIEAGFAAPQAVQMLERVTAEGAPRAAYRGRWQLAVQHATGEAGDDETENSDADKNFDAYVAPLKLDGEDGMIATFVDVTEATAAERLLQRQASLAAVGQAAAQVAHEIKNPLGSIRLGVSLLREMTTEQEARDTIKLVERGIEHLNKLTVDVTQYSRERPLERAPTDLHELLDASLELVRDKTEAKRITVERRYDAGARHGDFGGDLDADQLRQVFVNLLANAIDASADDAHITITTALRPRDAIQPGALQDGHTRLAVITIADRGTGMDASTRERLFEPFFTTKQRGTGLGLAVTKKIVEQHGGAISVESEPGTGTTFTTQLPI